MLAGTDFHGHTLLRVLFNEGNVNRFQIAFRVGALLIILQLLGCKPPHDPLVKLNADKAQAERQQLAAQNGATSDTPGSIQAALKEVPRRQIDPNPNSTAAAFTFPQLPNSPTARPNGVAVKTNRPSQPNGTKTPDKNVQPSGTTKPGLIVRRPNVAPLNPKPATAAEVAVEIIPEQPIEIESTRRFQVPVWFTREARDTVVNGIVYWEDEDEFFIVVNQLHAVIRTGELQRGITFEGVEARVQVDFSARESVAARIVAAQRTASGYALIAVRKFGNLAPVQMASRFELPVGERLTIWGNGSLRDQQDAGTWAKTNSEITTEAREGITFELTDRMTFNNCLVA
ncbi:MAG: hypothetical protein ACI9HK_003332, partial [Pirellulaceae bacterium]